MELLIHSGDDYVGSFEPESLAILVLVYAVCAGNKLPSIHIDVCKTS